MKLLGWILIGIVFSFIIPIVIAGYAKNWEGKLSKQEGHAIQVMGFLVLILWTGIGLLIF